ncbi:hypothetical protein PMI07_005009 [Rhizobium sp. CF080]|nr:hypothetical protein PMI07_005009 [Rhizobium sp. CF080]
MNAAAIGRQLLPTGSAVHGITQGVISGERA